MAPSPGPPLLWLRCIDCPGTPFCDGFLGDWPGTPCAGLLASMLPGVLDAFGPLSCLAEGFLLICVGQPWL